MTNILDNTDPVVDPQKNYLEELVGEGKKFKSSEELARGKYESDLYIKTLERTRDEQRQDYLRLDADYKSRASLEELIDQLSTQKQTQSSESPPAKADQPTFDPKQIESLLDNKLQQYEVGKAQQANIQTVQSKLIERFGNNYQNAVKEQIQTLGLTSEDFEMMARTRPTVLIRALGLDQPVTPQPFQAPVKSNQAFAPTGPNKRNLSYYDKMRRDNPKQYHDPKTVVQMHNDAIYLGKEFDDTGELGFKNIII